MDKPSLLSPEPNHSQTPGRPDGFSLLWPPGARGSLEAGRTTLDQAAARDLGLAGLVKVFTADSEHQKEVLRVLLTLCQDVDTIRYRQDVLEDLIHNPRLAGRIEALLPTIDALNRDSHRVVKDMTTLHEVTWRLGELQGVVDCIQGLGEAFREIGERLGSSGLRRLRDEIVRLEGDQDFQTLVKELPGLLAEVRTCASVTIGVNLDQFLRPVEATLLAVNEEKFTSQSMLNRLFGKKVNKYAGIAQLHSVPKREVEGHYALPIDSELGWAVEPMMVPLFKDLAEVIEKTMQPVAKELKRYAEIQGRLFTNLRQDLIFYLGALRFIKRMRGHRLPMSRPELVEQEVRVCQIQEAYNVQLALRLGGTNLDQDLTEMIVLNDVEMGEAGRVLIVTGPNQGGKTTFMQGAALAQVLAQAGLYVPGSQARISPVDQLFTHFPIEEKPEAETGRFGEEAQRLGEIFRRISRYSLILLNETFSSTNAGEGLYLAQDVVRILRRIGARAIFSTHLHELAAQADEVNQTTPGDSKVTSLVSSPVVLEGRTPHEIRRSYRIEARPPTGRSYAHEIAARYGIGYDELEKTLSDRGVLKERMDGK